MRTTSSKRSGPSKALVRAEKPRGVRSCKLDNIECEFLNGDGQPVELYQVKVDKGANEVNCFVEAEEGKEFAVRLSAVQKEHRAFRSVLSLGGHPVEACAHDAGQWKHCYTTRSVGPDKEQTFKFAKANITDDDKNSVRDPAEAARLCEVTIRFKQVRHFHRIDGPLTIVDAASPLVPEKAIYEKSKKVGAVGFAAGETSKSTRKLQYFRPCEMLGGAVVTFNIRCVTRVGLQLMHLIPHDTVDPEEKAREKAKEAAKRKREEEALVQERERLRKRLRELEAKEQALADASQDAGESSVRVKREKLNFDYSFGGDSVDNALVLDSDEDADD